MFTPDCAIGIDLPRPTESGEGGRWEEEDLCRCAAGTQPGGWGVYRHDGAFPESVHQNGPGKKKGIAESDCLPVSMFDTEF